MSKFKGFGKPPVNKTKSLFSKALANLIERGVKDSDTGLVYVTLPTGATLVCFQQEGQWYITQDSIEKAIEVPTGSFDYWLEHEYEPKHGITKPIYYQP